LPFPIFTPSTKADVGHDENISFDEAAKIIGKSKAEKVREMAIMIYSTARDYARKRGILIADTKFEFGLVNNQMMLIDEIFTPDSSRFWEKSTYQEGLSPPSYDKQILRDYLETTDWNKENPGPELPDDICQKLSQKYQEIFLKLTSKI